jgi:CheY-like chemotaxis protein
LPLHQNHPNHRHVKVVLTAGARDPIDDEEAGRAGADGRLHKPFEASVVIELARRLVEEARQARMAANGQDTLREVTRAEAAPEPQPEGEGAEAVEARREAGSEPDSLVLAEPACASDGEPPAAVSEPVVNQKESQDAREAAAAFARPDPEAVRAAVTLALESALPVLIDEITQRVTVAFEDAMAQSQKAGKSIEPDAATGA